MNNTYDEIAAICTPPGKSGIGIIRVSGPLSLEKTASIIKSKYPLLSYKKSKDRKLIYAHLMNIENKKIDEILVAYLPSNKAYTKEPTIELYCHGGRAILQEALKTILNNGIRLAEPGEFTRRAVENGRINIIQAESINGLINAKTKKALNAAWKQYDGNYINKCEVIKKNLISFISEAYYSIEFENEKNNNIIKNVKYLENCIEKIDDIKKNAEKCNYIFNGIEIVFTGKPNAGKSSIFNSILNTERSIVNKKPGTTRDYISELMELEGIEIKLTDTAGIRKIKNEIEEKSVENSYKKISNADFIVCIIDGSKKINFSNHKYLLEILNKNECFILLNKSDLKFHKTVIEFEEKNKDKKIMRVSALNKTGIDFFIQKISEEIIKKTEIDFEYEEVINNRQEKLLEKSKNSLILAIENIRKKEKTDLAIFEVENSIKCLKESIGEINKEEIFENIFKNFCVGK